MIFNYWKIHMACPLETISWSQNHDDEGIFWYDGYNATFWYLLNVEWYRMNNKLLAKTGNTEVFDLTLLRDYDPENIHRYGTKWTHK